MEAETDLNVDTAALIKTLQLLQPPPLIMNDHSDSSSDDDDDFWNAQTVDERPYPKPSPSRDKLHTLKEDTQWLEDVMHNVTHESVHTLRHNPTRQETPTPHPLQDSDISRILHDLCQEVDHNNTSPEPDSKNNITQFIDVDTATDDIDKVIHTMKAQLPKEIKNIRLIAQNDIGANTLVTD